MVRGILAPSVLDRPVCGRRERRKVGGELLHHHVYKQLSSRSSSSTASSSSSSTASASDETLLPDFMYLDLSNTSSNRDEKKTLQPLRQKTGGNKSAFKPGGSQQRRA
ncbi:hypothetical protein THAOC_26619 [Thalassiosira oceanica]|uniref:Uncharacterized protein n=1 Tax=Thalassiosira oceanica TaxID=159749 RepID=K0RJI8_THAOC|nr:hypothetical protein THAOC_26619 [Thalassiosira oceanica]|mmetsp:Transcript_11755/g.27606  ORF Transcript_11755/g.27606 Transcript_11755/m.27606 type:complete len:108 (-) Transcript_11755:178-501(-)|eukprot:EJK53863.1 hypothetical protein THAOC_26619 [Thalassiosira oceanica]